MDQLPVETTARRSLFTRILLMILMAIAYSLSGTVLFIVAVIQIAFTLFTDMPNSHLIPFSRSLGLYFQQIVSFQTFVTEELPFPFNDWPS
ncbi:MAG: DUF4389 domain-containing protein [Proteobacteria bacterium]|nr:DUF4389 domain-containing protein [Pseudomonadota bacterium]